MDEGGTDIRTIVQQKNLDLSRESDHSKQLAHRLVEKVIPRMIMKLEQPLKKGSGIRGRMLRFAQHYVDSANGTHWETIVSQWEEKENEDLIKSAQELTKMLKAAREASPRTRVADGKLVAILNLDGEDATFKFRYHPNRKNIKWQMFHYGK